MADGVAVRAAAPADAGAIASISARGWRRAFRELLPEAYLRARAATRWEPLWRDYLEAVPAAERVWVVERDGRVLGFARSGLGDEGDHELFGLYVEPDELGTGLGRALLEHVREDVRSRGGGELTLWTFVGNERAERFYRRAGLEPDGAERTWRDGETEAPERRYRGPLAGA